VYFFPLQVTNEPYRMEFFADVYLFFNLALTQKVYFLISNFMGMMMPAEEAVIPVKTMPESDAW
jgi:hypothetical protein